MAQRQKKKNKNVETGTESELMSESLDEEHEKNKIEEVKYAKFNLSVLDPEIEKNFDTKDYVSNIKREDN